MKKLLTISGIILLSACTGTPQYQQLTWATISMQQAEAECLADVQRDVTLGMPVCMKAKGWELVGYQ